MIIYLGLLVPEIRDPDSDSATFRLDEIQNEGLTLAPGDRSWWIDDVAAGPAAGESLAMRTERAVLDAGRFSPATVRYWFEWFAARGTFPPDAAAAIAWISEREEGIGQGLTLPDAWIPAD